MKTLKNTIKSIVAIITIVLATSSANAQMSPYKFDQVFNQAFAQVVEGNHKAALPLLERLHASDSEHGQVQYLFALTRIKMGNNPGNTVELLERAAKNFSFYHQSGRAADRTAPVTAWMHLANAYAKQYNYDKAIEAYRNYMSCIPMATLDEKRVVIAKIKKLKFQKLAAQSTDLSSNQLALLKP